MTTNSKEYSREYMRKKRQKDPDLNKRYYESHKEQMRESSKKWYENNKEKRLKRIREYHKENQDITYRAFKKYFMKYQKERRANDPRYCLDQNVLRTARRTLKNVKNPKEEIWIKKLGYKMKSLRAYLKNKIPEGYTWTDYINGDLQLDHIIPRYLFDYESTTDPSFKKCWAMKNLRLLPKEKNKLNYFTGIKYKKEELLKI